MAKGNRQLFAFICPVCKSQNYVMTRNKINTPDKLELKKFCRRCRKQTLHKETSKLK